MTSVPLPFEPTAEEEAEELAEYERHVRDDGHRWYVTALLRRFRTACCYGCDEERCLRCGDRDHDGDCGETLRCDCEDDEGCPLPHIEAVTP